MQHWVFIALFYQASIMHHESVVDLGDPCLLSCYVTVLICHLIPAMEDIVLHLFHCCFLFIQTFVELLPYTAKCCSQNHYQNAQHANCNPKTSTVVTLYRLDILWTNFQNLCFRCQRLKALHSKNQADPFDCLAKLAQRFSIFILFCSSIVLLLSNGFCSHRINCTNATEEKVKPGFAEILCSHITVVPEGGHLGHLNFTQARQVL